MKTPTILLALTLALASCGETETITDTPAESPSSSLDAIILDAAPENAESITKIRKDITPGKEIVIEGKVMGRSHPFVESRAMVVIGDPAKITSCDLRPGDNCTTPWDVCCDDPETIKQSVATIQVLDDNGKLIKQGLKGVNDIKELSKLIIKGTIAEGSNPDNLLINATGIYLKK